MDAILHELTRFVDWEGSVTWLTVPADPEACASWNVPDRWREAVISPRLSAAERVRLLWGPLSYLLPRSALAFSQKVSGLALLQTRLYGLSLIYVFEDNASRTRRGFAPVAQLPSIASELPVDLSPLFELHDGLVHFMSYDGGPLRSQDWKETPDPSGLSRGLLKILADGSEALGFDMSEPGAPAYVVQPGEDLVDPVPDVWGYIDGAIAGPFED